MSNAGDRSRVPLFVDLDGTLVRTDTLHEALVLHLRRGPWRIFQLLSWLAQGRAGFKRRLVEAGAVPEVETLPYRESVVALTEQARDEGRPTVLITASDAEVAGAVGRHLGLFDQVHGSDGVKNLKGSGKLTEIESICEREGWSAFDYVGDSRADVPIWEKSDTAYVVASGAAGGLRSAGVNVEVVEAGGVPVKPFIKALRPHQWAKNVLIFVPLLLAQEWGELDRVMAATLAFVAFSLAASSVYVTNDLLDLPVDRRHHSKRRRPFAAGTLPVAIAPFLSVGLLGASAAVSLFLLPLSFSYLLATYLVITLAYSWWLKGRLLVDVFTLTTLYSIRILGGGYATETAVTEWLLAFAGFLFTSLAFAKRFTELAHVADSEEGARIRGRAYAVQDLDIIQSVGPASGYMAVLVLALYINSDQVSLLYPNPVLLWLMCPLLMYWLTRLWFFARRRDLHEDPVVFAITDRISLLTGIVAVALVLAATQGWGPVLP